MFARHLSKRLKAPYTLSASEEDVCKKSAELLDNSIKKTVVKKQFITFRAVTHEFAFDLNLDDLPGTKYFDGAFLSTSPSLDAAADIGIKRNADTLVVLLVTEGSNKGIYINDLSEKKGVELEFLMNRRKEYHIISVTKGVYIHRHKYNIVVVSDEYDA